MSIGQYNLQQDLVEAEAMVHTMPGYVRQDNLFYTLGGTLPQMTLGGFLIRSRRLRLFQDRLSAKEVVTLHDIENRHRDVLDEWRYHYVKMIGAEVLSRQRTVTYFLNECAEDLTSCQHVYRPEAFRRTAIQHVVEIMKRLQVDNLDVVSQDIGHLDQGLQAVLERDEFLWDDELRPIYPEDTYWWLYCKPIKSDEATTTGLPN